MLKAKLRKWVPARIKKHEQRTNVVLGGNRQKGVDSFLETGSVLLPEEVVQEDPHRVHAQTLSPTQFLVDLLRIKAGGLPHFEFIDCVCRDKVAAHQPGLG